jgi:hypothetical protein
MFDMQFGKPQSNINVRVVNLGKNKKRHVRKFKKGRGPLMTEVHQEVQNQRAFHQPAPGEEDKPVQHLVLVYKVKESKKSKKKRKRKKRNKKMVNFMGLKVNRKSLKQGGMFGG